MTSDQRVTAAFIIIGNEILSGRTQDANLSFLAGRLGEIGIQMVEARVIPDVEQTIIDTVQTLSAQVDYVFTSGGIGPTHDDITADAVAKAFGTETFEDPEAVALLEAHYAAGEFNAARRKMARVPRGSTLLANPVSTAPGFRIGNVHVLAGVPKIMQAMVDMLLPGLTGGAVVESRTITVLIGESLIAPEMAAVENAHPGIDVGSYPYFKPGASGTSIVLRGADVEELERALADVTARLEARDIEIWTGDHK